MKWTDDQIETLKELYPNNRNEDIMKLMGLSEMTIRNKAGRLGLIKTKEHKSKMIGNRNKIVGTDITLDVMRETALKYKTRGEFQRLDNSIYTTTRVAGLLDEFCSHMIKGNYSIPQLILYFIINEIFDCEVIYNTKDIISPYELDVFIPKYNIAFEYDGKHWHKDNKKDLIKNKICNDRNIKLIRIVENARDYIKDIKEQLVINIDFIKKYTNITNEFILNIREDIIYDFVNNNINDIEDIRKIISKYKKYSDFRKNELKLYQKLINRNLLSELNCLEKELIYWDDELIKNEINKYEYLGEFIKKSYGCYLHIKKNKKEYLLEKLRRKNCKYTIDDIRNEISKYTKLSELRTKSPNIYTHIKKNKLLYLTKELMRER